MALVTPVAAADVRDAIGVNVRTAFQGTPHANLIKVRQALDYMGIRRVRDALWPPGETAQWNFFRQLGAAGIKGTINPTAASQESGFFFDLLVPNLTAIRDDSQLRAFVDRLEGANEVDISAGGASMANTVSYQTAMWDFVKGTESMAHIPIVATSFATSGGLDLFAGDLAAISDFGNMHPYPAGQKPAKIWEDGFWMPKFAAVTPGRPLQATEVGYHTDVTSGGGHPGVSQSARVPYTLQLILEHLWRGTSRVDLYTIVEQTANASTDGVLTTADWGFYDFNWDPHPVAHAVRNFTTAIGDGTSELEPLDVATSGSADLKSLLFRRSDRIYVLALWRNVSLWNTSTGQAISVNPATITVTVPSALAANQIQPAVSSSFTPLTLNSGSATVSVGADPVLVQIYTESLTSTRYKSIFRFS